jgi:hypothetical protein
MKNILGRKDVSVKEAWDGAFTTKGTTTTLVFD